MLKLIHSNDLLQLAARLADLQQSQPLPPLEAETVIVQSNELARWLSLFLAGQHGISSHIDFPYPSAFIWALFRRLLPDIPQQSPFSTDAMTWKLFELLPACRQQTGFESIDAYLGLQDDVIKRYDLAHRIADSYDQYLMYRPDWIETWEQGEAPHWQARLWQLLTKGEVKPQHRANLLLQLKHYLSSTETKPTGLPNRIAIFGLSALPPVYLELFELMSQHCDIHLFFLSPSEEYWGDLLNPKAQARKELDSPEQEQYLATGHPLLASLGKQGQDFFEQLQNCTMEEESHFIEPQQTSLLEKLQHDIYALTDIDSLSQKQQISTDDDSIMVHSCHSAMREIEVLHDQLLALFERHPDLSPTDVVVMTSNIEIYSPWIDAVFGSSDKAHTLPYSIADGGIKSQSHLLTAFNSLLDLPQSRFDVESIVSLLECESIQKRYSFDQDQLELIRRWLRETHTAWGLSADDKVSLGLPANDANTWRAGLDRLLLGYAIPESSGQLFDGRLGFDGISSDRAETMAKLCGFIDDLDRYRQRLKAQLTTIQWQKLVLKMLDTFFLANLDNSKEEAELLLIRKTLDTLVETTNLAEFQQTISVDLVKEWCEGHLDTEQTQMRFMGQGITFCGMVPMRSIPFKVVCLIGMNDGSFPRRQVMAGFDLMSRPPIRKGDRSQRNEDRYLFLESLLSAQAHFYISYVGASIVDNSLIPPSVLISDVRDVLRLSFVTADSEDIWQQILTEHPLQAFSQRYFNNSSPKLFSYVAAHCPPSKEQEGSENWFKQLLPEADESWKTVNLVQLLAFYRHPARFLLRERLGLYLESDEEQLDPREPFDLDGLQAWSLRQQLLQYRLSENSLSAALPMIQATGELPQGTVGEMFFDKQAEKVEVFADKLFPDYPDEFLAPLAFSLEINNFVLQGQLDGLTANGRFSFRMAKAKGGELLATWLQHLILNCIQPDNINYESHWITEDKDYHFLPVKEAKTLLSDLLDLYWQGLQQPLPLFSSTSYVFAKASLNGGRANPEKAMFAAWQGNMKLSGEKEDLYYQQVYDETPLEEHFKTVALAVYEPLQAHLREGEL
ncbi:MAG: exodeoxyribonuclease V subunit gamma [Methylophaga sp.]|nr:exodeoxyribonuclease V subunit gamma [Methylophaga sp.]